MPVNLHISATGHDFEISRSWKNEARVKDILAEVLTTAEIKEVKNRGT